MTNSHSTVADLAYASGDKILRTDSEEQPVDAAADKKARWETLHDQAFLQWLLRDFGDWGLQKRRESSDQRKVWFCADQCEDDMKPFVTRQDAIQEHCAIQLSTVQPKSLPTSNFASDSK
eukprot:3331353-Amphidinium_carterae.1